MGQLPSSEIKAYQGWADGQFANIKSEVGNVRDLISELSALTNTNSSDIRKLIEKESKDINANINEEIISVNRIKKDIIKQSKLIIDGKSSEMSNLYDDIFKIDIVKDINFILDKISKESILEHKSVIKSICESILNKNKELQMVVSKFLDTLKIEKQIYIDDMTEKAIMWSFTINKQIFDKCKTHILSSSIKKKLVIYKYILDQCLSILIGSQGIISNFSKIIDSNLETSICTNVISDGNWTPILKLSMMGKHSHLICLNIQILITSLELTRNSIFILQELNS